MIHVHYIMTLVYCSECGALYDVDDEVHVCENKEGEETA